MSLEQEFTNAASSGSLGDSFTVGPSTEPNSSDRPQSQGSDRDIEAAVREAADLIYREFRDTPQYCFPFRYALEICHRVLFARVNVVSPSLELGIGDGTTSAYTFHGRGQIDWGTDMPAGSTLETKGAESPYAERHFRNRLVCNGQSIPFADNSFATVQCIEVLGQDLDRAKMVSEMVRVLAPGGTIAFCENSAELLNHPALLEAVCVDNPHRGNVVDEQWYRELLTRLGCDDLWSCQFLDAPVALPVYAMLYCGLVSRGDEKMDAVYRGGLEGFLPLLAKELSDPEQTRHGFHLFVKGRKRGALPTDLPAPAPACPSCLGSIEMKQSAAATCATCRQEYAVVNGILQLVR